MELVKKKSKVVAESQDPTLSNILHAVIGIKSDFDKGNFDSKEEAFAFKHVLFQEINNISTATDFKAMTIKYGADAVERLGLYLIKLRNELKSEKLIHAKKEQEKLEKVKNILSKALLKRDKVKLQESIENVVQETHSLIKTMKVKKRVYLEHLDAKEKVYDKLLSVLIHMEEKLSVFGIESSIKMSREELDHLATLFSDIVKYMKSNEKLNFGPLTHHLYSLPLDLDSV